MGMYSIGLDLGQRQDFSAIAVVERRGAPGSAKAPERDEFAVRRVERVPLGTPYPRVVERVREMTQSDALAGRCAVVVDATGVGAPVVDLLRGAQMGCEIHAVTITGGERANSGHSAGGARGLGVTRWSVPKRDLIAGVEVLLDQRQLRIARQGNETGALVRELLDMKMKATERGRVRMGAEGYGEHDDLVIALALACWHARQKRNPVGGCGGRLPWM